MAIWLPYKAKPNELKSRCKPNTITQQFCKICGRPIRKGNMCGGCNNFINRKRNEERQGNL